jgi:hypothetical protein
MTKRKTALQSSIEEIQDILNSRGANESNCDDYELGLIESVKILKSKLPEEKQDLIDAHYIGQKQLMNEETDEMNAELYFNNTFEYEN